MRTPYLPIFMAFVALIGIQPMNAQHAKPQPEKVSQVATLVPLSAKHQSAANVFFGGGLPDDCTTAQVLTVGTDCSPVTVSAAGASESLPAIVCNGFTSGSALDVWFTFQATSQVTIVEVLGTGVYDAVLEIFSGDCAGLTSVGCVDQTFPPNSTLEVATIVTTIGSTYFVRVYNYTPPAAVDNQFTICAYAGADPPANDQCTGAVDQALAVGGSVTFAGDNTGATDTEGFGFASVWHSFTTTECTNLTLSYCATTPAFGNAFLEIFNGCPSTGSIMSSSFDVTTCGNNNVTIFYEYVPAGTWYYAVLTDIATEAVGPYSITVSAVACPPGYCAASAETCDEYIAQVQFGSIDNSSGCTDGPAVDYTSISTTVTQGGVVPITVTNGPETYDGDQVVVWIDWNQNQSFFDAGEAYVLTTADVAVTFTGDIAVPFNALPGSTRMRIRMMYTGVPSPCGSSQYGEVEDYTVMVEAGVSCDADAGTITADGVVCIETDPVTLTATVNGDAVVPPGFEVIHVLTEGAGLLIVGVDALAEFEVNAPGTYTIHTLVYDPLTLDLSTVVIGTTTGFDVNGLLIQGGGSICGSLDVTGAEFVVEICCDAEAGTLSGADTLCYEGSPLTLTALVNGDAVVPPGFEVIYVLTAGPGLVIEAAGANPEFPVDATGNYTIHTLVYDPLTLDLASIVFGVTTGFDVNGLLIQGGGTICASLDVAGAAFVVELCCDALAGTLSGGDTLCYEGATLTLTATANGDIVVPLGFEVIYVLTEGAGLVITGTSATPTFDVNATGDYTIHTLVYEPATLDLTIVVPGTTTGFDVNGLLIQGGGTICASLDVAGAAYSVILCCDADAGTLSGGAEVCLVDGNATLTAVADGNTNVPAGYEVVHVLTQGPGLVIIGVDADPEFVVDALGSYTIHTLVYDPMTLDLSTVVLGVTTGVDVNGLLIQGGGTICASLDVSGAPFTVVDCSGYCDAGADGTGLGLDERIVNVTFADINNTSPNVTTTPPSYSDFTNVTGTVEVTATYTITVGVNSSIGTSYNTNQVLVWIDYDQNEVFDASELAFTSTIEATATYTGTITIPGGATLGATRMRIRLHDTHDGSAYTNNFNDTPCGLASYGEVEDYTLNLIAFSSVEEHNASAWSVFPNPGNGDITIQYGGHDTKVTMEVMDMTGRLIHGEVMGMTQGGQVLLPLAGRLAAGTYIIRFTSDKHIHEQRFIVR